jgi:Helicase associated domain
MTPERAKLLEDLGFSWGTCATRLVKGQARHESSSHFLVPTAAEVRPGMERHRVSWHERFLELKTFVKTNGHFNVSPVTNAPLYAWCSEQLQRLKNLAEQPPSSDGSSEPKVKGLGQDRVKILADIGFTKDVELSPVLCEAGAAALAAETAARELDGHSSHDEDDDHYPDEHHEDDDDEASHHDKEGNGFNESSRPVRRVDAAIPRNESGGLSVEV